MATGVQVWSTTASQNSTSDTNVNWAEGMAPSQVNDSARAVMASVAKWRDDNTGTLITSGTTTAVTVATNQVESALTSGYTLKVQFGATPDSSATLNVDGLGAKPIQTVAGTNMVLNDFVTGTPYTFIYSSTGTGQWISEGSPLIPASVTYAKIQNVAASRLLGNPTGSPAAASEITLGTNLTFSGTTLNAGNNTPVVTVITSTATATWQSTTQNGNFPLYLHVRMVGAGGGGGAVATNTGSSGLDTSFNNWTAIAGAGGGPGSNDAGGAGGSGGTNGTGTLITRVSGARGSFGTGGATVSAPGNGGSSFYGGAGASLGSSGGNAAANTGSGGGGGNNGGVSSAAGGGAGEYVEFLVTSPSTSYTVQVGAGGAGGPAGTVAGGNGAAGRIEVIAYWQ